MLIPGTGTIQADGDSVYAQGLSLSFNVAAGTITCAIGIGRSTMALSAGGPNAGTYPAHPTRQNCVLYLPTYKLSPEVDAKYFSSEYQTVNYRDYQCISNTSQLLNLAGGNSYTATLTPGISNLRKLIIMPFMSAITHGTVTANVALKSNTFGTGIPTGSPLLSPFSRSPGTLCPFARLSNFQIKVNGTSFYETATNYGYQQFYEEWRKSGGAYGGQVLQISSGLLSQTAWESLYPYVVVDLNT